MTFWLKILLGAASLAIVLAIGILVAAELKWSSGYVEEEVTNGVASGITVGASTSETIETLRLSPGAGSTRAVVYRNNEPTKLLVNTLQELDVRRHGDAQKIVLLGGNAAVDEVTIEFQASRVVRVHTRRRAFDL